MIKSRIDAQKALVEAAVKADEISGEEAAAALAEAAELDGDDWQVIYIGLTRYRCIDIEREGRRQLQHWQKQPSSTGMIGRYYI